MGGPGVEPVTPRLQRGALPFKLSTRRSRVSAYGRTRTCEARRRQIYSLVRLPLRHVRVSLTRTRHRIHSHVPEHAVRRALLVAEGAFEGDPEALGAAPTPFFAVVHPNLPPP